MNTIQAKQQGVAAYRAGKGRAPALNGPFLRAACAACAACAGGELAALLDAYIHGWTIAMLADGAPADMPSVSELAVIEAA